jgi:hypothetical protein
MDTWSIDPLLRRLVLYCWLARLSDDSPIPLDNLGDEYSMLGTTQEAIGDDSILFGYFAHEWVRLQERYLKARELPRGRNQTADGIKAIALQLLEQCHECWLIRNLHLHGTYPNNTYSYKHLHLLAQVTALYESAPPTCGPPTVTFSKSRSNRANSNPRPPCNPSFCGPIQL